jgi:MraZ protein
MSGTGTPIAFIGRYYHALEQKGRLSIPVSFREGLKPSAVLTRGLDGCLFLFALKEWEVLSAQSASLPLTRKTSRDWLRLLANNAAVVTFDSLGRILIPEYLRETAGLTKQVVVVGSLTRVEIWNQASYSQYLKNLESNAETIAESIGGEHGPE